MRDVELLMPAGNLEKLEYAVKYGADAVYLGVVDFSLRALRKGSLITMENIKEAVDLAHLMGAKAYVTINIFAFNSDIKLLEASLERFKDANPDAFIISDYGILNLIKRNIPDVPLHISTQTNTLNYESVKFWRDLGASRVILARELPISDIAEIRRQVPDIELECFVHGAQCVSFSGRCLLSDYFSKGERKANHGNCTQPCRWSYKLVEETRPGEYLEINQDDRGSHILSPKDLCLVKQLPQLIEAGVDSLKVEGRTKSLYYVSAVAKAYRQAIDEVLKNPSDDLDKYFIELQKEAMKNVLENIKSAQNTDKNLTTKIIQLRDQIEKVPSLQEFIDYYQLDLGDIYNYKRSFSSLLANASILKEDSYANSKQGFQFFQRISQINSQRFLSFIKNSLIEEQIDINNQFFKMLLITHIEQ